MIRGIGQCFRGSMPKAIALASRVTEAKSGGTRSSRGPVAPPLRAPGQRAPSAGPIKRPERSARAGPLPQSTCFATLRARDVQGLVGRPRPTAAKRSPEQPGRGPPWGHRGAQLQTALLLCDHPTPLRFDPRSVGHASTTAPGMGGQAWTASVAQAAAVPRARARGGRTAPQGGYVMAIAGARAERGLPQTPARAILRSRRPFTSAGCAAMSML